VPVSTNGVGNWDDVDPFSCRPRAQRTGTPIVREVVFRNANYAFCSGDEQVRMEYLTNGPLFQVLLTLCIRRMMVYGAWGMLP